MGGIKPLPCKVVGNFIEQVHLFFFFNMQESCIFIFIRQSEIQKCEKKKVSSDETSSHMAQLGAFIGGIIRRYQQKDALILLIIETRLDLSFESEGQILRTLRNANNTVLMIWLSSRGQKFCFHILLSPSYTPTKKVTKMCHHWSAL